MLDRMYQEKNPKGKQKDKFVVRLPDGLRDRIAAAADRNHRSMNKEVVARILETFDYKTGEPEAYGVREGGFLKQDEARMLNIFRRLSPQRQRALIDLLEPEDS